MARQLYVLTELEENLIKESWLNVLNQVKCEAPELLDSDGSINTGLEDFNFQDYREGVLLEMQPNVTPAEDKDTLEIYV